MVYHARCEDVIASVLPVRDVALVHADPPYGIGYKPVGKAETSTNAPSSSAAISCSCRTSEAGRTSPLRSRWGCACSRAMSSGGAATRRSEGLARSRPRKPRTCAGCRCSSGRHGARDPRYGGGVSIASYTKAPRRASAADPLGFDMKVGVDLDPSGRSATGLELVDDAILHRLQEEQLLLVEAPGGVVGFGIDLRRWIGEALSDQALEARTPQVEEAIRRDPRIADVTVRVTRTIGADASRWPLRVEIHGVTTTGETIDRIVGVSQVSVEFLAQGR